VRSLAGSALDLRLRQIEIATGSPFYVLPTDLLLRNGLSPKKVRPRAGLAVRRAIRPGADGPYRTLAASLEGARSVQTGREGDVLDQTAHAVAKE